MNPPATAKTGAPVAPPRSDTATVALTIDGRKVSVSPGTSIRDAARSLGIEVPLLCHDPRLRPVGVCRMCVVEVKGARTLPASCVRPCEAGMEVATNSEVVERNRSMLTELLLADPPTPCARETSTGDCDLEPEAFVEVRPDDCRRLGVATGDGVRGASRRGSLRVRVPARDATPPGSVFVAFCFREAAANLLKTDALDPIGKIPEFKYCAVRVEREATVTGNGSR